MLVSVLDSRLKGFYSKALVGSLFCVLGQNILQDYYYNSASINPGVQMGSSELNA